MGCTLEVCLNSRDLQDGENISGYGEEFSHSTRDVHEIVRKTLTDNAKKVKHKVDYSKRDV